MSYPGYFQTGYYQNNVYYQSDVFAPDYFPAPIELPKEDLTGEDLEKFLNKIVYPVHLMERDRLYRLEMWACGRQPEVRPLKRNTERAVLQRLARTPWIPLMISTFAQQMVVDGYHRDGEMENSEAWKSWLRNKMTMQQLAINRATMTYGYSYVRVTESDEVDEAPGNMPFGDDGDGPEDNSGANKIAVMRAIDPMDCFALYEDPYLDEYPMYVLERMPNRDHRFWMPNGDYYWIDHDKGKLKVGALVETPYGKPPFVRYVNQIDLKGRCWGDVEGVIDLAARIDKTAFDRLMVQHFNSFKIRWATGLEQADTPEGVEQDKIRIGNEDILIASDSNAKFGTLNETSMTGFIEAYKCDLETFAAVMQLPPNLMGQVINVAADALDGARRQTYQRLFEKQTVYGEAHAQVMRLAALIEGRGADAEDFFARIHWQDVEVRSLAQFADAWGKIVDQLGVPKWAPWHKIPGVEQSEVESWKKHALDDDPLSKYLRELGLVPAPSARTGLPGAALPSPGDPGGPTSDPAALSKTQGKGPGGPNSTKNQPKVNNKTGNPKPTKPTGS